MNKWTAKQLKLISKIIRRIEIAYKNEYIRVLDEIKGLVLDLYAQIELEGKPLVSHLYKYKRLYNLTKNIQSKLTQLGVRQEEIFTKEMENFYKQNVAILNDEFEKPFSITDEKVKEIVREYVLSNTLWSESIWKDKALLLSKVKHQLVMHITAGKSIDEMAKVLQPETLTTNFYNSKRLVRTEVIKYYASTTLEKYKAAGVKEVQYNCVNDDRSCEVCRSNNEKIFPIDKAKGMIPSHPNCRCFWTPVIR